MICHNPTQTFELLVSSYLAKITVMNCCNLFKFCIKKEQQIQLFILLLTLNGILFTPKTIWIKVYGCNKKIHPQYLVCLTKTVVITNPFDKSNKSTFILLYLYYMTPKIPPNCNNNTEINPHSLIFRLYFSKSIRIISKRNIFLIEAKFFA